MIISNKWSHQKIGSWKLQIERHHECNKHAVYKEKVDKEFVKQLDYNLIGTKRNNFVLQIEQDDLVLKVKSLVPRGTLLYNQNLKLAFGKT